MKYFLVVFFIIFNSNISVQASSSKYKGGELKIIKKNNEACFYINNKGLKGEYELNVFDKKNFYKISNYSSNFNNYYPSQNNCIKIKYNFKNNYIYTAVLDSEVTNFGSDFCFIGNELGKFDGVKCTINKASFWERIIKFFNATEN